MLLLLLTYIRRVTLRPTRRKRLQDGKVERHAAERRGDRRNAGMARSSGFRTGNISASLRRRICSHVHGSPEIFHREPRSEEHTSELQSLMRISYAVFCLKKKRQKYDKSIRYKIEY